MKRRSSSNASVFILVCETPSASVWDCDSCLSYLSPPEELLLRGCVCTCVRPRVMASVCWCKSSIEH